MANLALKPEWAPGIYQFETTDDVIGGPDGLLTLPHRQLGDRTEWLKAQLEAIAPYLDNINGEVIPVSIEDKLSYLDETKALIRASIQNKGVSVPIGTAFRNLTDYVGYISGVNSDVRDVVNVPWFNPGTLLGGISWVDPSGDEFDSIEILDVYNGANEVVAEIEPGVQYWEPDEGTHQYRIRAKLPSGGYTVGVELPVTAYEVIYKANLLSITIPLSAANEVVLSFDNYVKVTDATGFTVSGITDTLHVLDQPDIKTVRLKLASKYFSQNGSYTLSYDPAQGNVLQNDDSPIDPIVGYSVENYADYTPAEFVSAQVPQAQPETLVLVMSRPINVENISAFALSGTSAEILDVVSVGETVEFTLNEPVDNSQVEPAIKISYNGNYVTDDAGQEVEAFANRPVSNNSTHQAISVLSAEIPSSSSKMLIVVMQGTINMQSADGFSLTSDNQSDLPDLSTTAYTISDGTIIFNFPQSLLAGKSFVVQYNGQGTLRATGENDKIKAFSQGVANHSTDSGGIPAGTSKRNLSLVVLGREPQTPAEVTQVCAKIHQTIASGQVANLVVGDYFYPVISQAHPFVVAAGYDAGGGMSLTANADLGAHGKHIGFQIVSRNGLKGKNGNTYDHVIIDMMNVAGYAGETNADGHYMNPSNTNTGGYLGCKMRQYLINNFLLALKNLGIPFDETWMAAPARKVSKGGGATNPGFDTITDKLFLATEYEMRGAHTYSNSQAEAAADQGRFEFYDSDEKRIKYNKDNAARYYWLASPYSGNSGNFCYVNTSGAATASYARGADGFAPAFCVA